MNENENNPGNKPAEPIEIEAVDQPANEYSEPSEVPVQADDTPAEARSKSPIAWPWMTVAVIAVAALIFVLVRNPQQAGVSGVNAAVGNLNGVPISKAEVYDEMVKIPTEHTAAQSALDQLMMFKLIDLEAKKMNVQASDAEINTEVAAVKKRFPSEDQFNSALQQGGLTTEMFKEQMAFAVKIRKIFEPQIKPTEDQLKQYYETNKANYSTTPEQVRASHILLATKAEADAVLAELKKGADFATLAKQKSTDPGSKDNGGDLDYFAHGVMNPEFEKAAFKLNKGGLSGVVQSPNGFHIIKVTDKKPAVTPPYDTVKQTVKSNYLDEHAQTLFPDWLTAKKKEYRYENLLAPAAPAASAGSSPAGSPAAPASK